MSQSCEKPLLEAQKCLSLAPCAMKGSTMRECLSDPETPAECLQFYLTYKECMRAQVVPAWLRGLLCSWIWDTDFVVIRTLYPTLLIRRRARTHSCDRAVIVHSLYQFAPSWPMIPLQCFGSWVLCCLRNFYFYCTFYCFSSQSPNSLSLFSSSSIDSFTFKGYSNRVPIVF